MAVALQLQIDDREVMNLMESLSRFGQAPMTGALRELGETVRGMALDAFAAEQSPEGDDWQQSARAAADGGLTLTDRATLKNSIGVQLDGDTVEIGSNLVYAAIHQLGGEAGRGHKVVLPARPYLPTTASPELRREALAIFGAALTEAMA